MKILPKKESPGLLIIICVCIAITFLAMTLTDITKGETTNPEGIILLNEPAYPEHTKGIVEFNHTAHHQERVRSKDCGVCHHDKDGKPIADLKEGDSVDRCITCHDKIGKIPKGTSKTDKLAWHKEAMHSQCKGCHRAFNKVKSDDQDKAPVSCRGCHPKKEK
jgi:hypothetical protein